jgi:hypothetical protein
MSICFHQTEMRKKVREKQCKNIRDISVFDKYSYFSQRKLFLLCRITLFSTE